MIRILTDSTLTCNSLRVVHESSKVLLGPKSCIATGVRAARKEFPGTTHIELPVVGDSQSVAEAAILGAYKYHGFKSSAKPKNLLFTLNSDNAEEQAKFLIGKIVAESQNNARDLMNCPANHMTPRHFVQHAQNIFSTMPKVSVTSHDTRWILEQKMNAFHAVAKGSQEPPLFLIVHYTGVPKRDNVDLALVGKGVTFDSGGISIKPSANMHKMKADMGGAATVLSSLHAIVQLELELNVSAYIPLCENMPSGTAVKPGDVVIASNGVSIEIDNTDAEGRLILADALVHAIKNRDPKVVVDVATLTGAIDVALGHVYAGVFTNSEELWHQLNKAGIETCDELWRMPLNEQFKKMMDSDVADMKNSGGRSAGSCTAAAFLREFIKNGRDCEVQWAHIDIAGVMENTKTSGCEVKGMSGKPVRALIQYARTLASCTKG